MITAAIEIWSMYDADIDRTFVLRRWPRHRVRCSTAARYAQAYPSQDIRLICAFPPGSGADVLVRYFAEKLRPIAGRTVIVENKSGAGGNIATEYVARAKPDGYTIYVHAGDRGRGQPAPVQEAAGRRRQGDPDRGHDQPPAVHAGGRCQEPLQDRRRPHRRDEAERRQGDLRRCGADRQHHGRNLQERRPASRRSRSTYKTAPDSLNEMLSGKLDYGMHDPVFSLAQQREGRLRILAVSTGNAAAGKSGHADDDRSRACRWT